VKLLLFLTGYTFGKQSGRPWRVGLLMVASGFLLISVVFGPCRVTDTLF
jgi:hypothetical protein